MKQLLTLVALLLVAVPAIGQTTEKKQPEFKLIQFHMAILRRTPVGSSRVDLQACKLEYSIVSPK